MAKFVQPYSTLSDKDIAYALQLSQEVYKLIPYSVDGLKALFPRLEDRLIKKMAMFSEAEIKELLTNDSALTSLIIKMFSQSVIGLFHEIVNNNGVRLSLHSMENATLFYHVMKAKYPDKLPLIEAITAALTLRTFRAEMALLNKTVSKADNGIKASQVSMTDTKLTWKKCPVIFRGYMRNLSMAGHPMAGDAENPKYIYSYDVGLLPAVAVVSFLAGVSLDEAQKVVQQEGSILLKAVPPETEAFLLKRILTMPSPILRKGLLRGRIADALANYEGSEKENVSVTDNLYTKEVHKVLLKDIGQKLRILEETLRVSGNTDKVEIYYMTERGFAIVCDEPLETLVGGGQASFMKLLKGLSLRNEGLLI